MTGVESYRRHTTCAHADDSPSRTFYISGVDVASGHDNHVLGTTTDHNMAVLSQISQIPGAQPALVVLGGHKTARRDVSGCHWISSYLDEPYTADWLDGAILIDDAGLYAVEHWTQ